MDFMNMMNIAANADLTNVDVDLPEELSEKIGEVFGHVVTTILEVAQYLYKTDSPTPEQLQEADIVAMLWLRKQLENTIHND